MKKELGEAMATMCFEVEHVMRDKKNGDGFGVVGGQFV